MNKHSHTHELSHNWSLTQSESHTSGPSHKRTLTQVTDSHADNEHSRRDVYQQHHCGTKRFELHAEVAHAAASTTTTNTTTATTITTPHTTAVSIFIPSPPIGTAWSLRFENAGAISVVIVGVATVHRRLQRLGY